MSARARRGRHIDRSARWGIACLASACVLIAASAWALLFGEAPLDLLGRARPVLSAGYVRSISGEGTSALVSPVGVALDGDRVLVADASRGEVVVFRRDGTVEGAFGKGILRTPLYLAVSPLTGRTYVTDRSPAGIAIFSSRGAFEGTLAAPARTPGSAPEASGTTSWRPVGVGFAPDGTLYVTDASDGHRVVSFGPTGGPAGEVATGTPVGPTGAALSYPNGVAATFDTIAVSDANNGRLVLVRRRDGQVTAVRTGGLLRGVSGVRTRSGTVFAVADTMSGEIHLVGRSGALLGASEPGGARQRMRFPAGVASSRDGLIYVADTGRQRVAVWRTGPADPPGILEIIAEGGWWPWTAGAAGVAAAVGWLLLRRVSRGRNPARAV